MKKLRITVGKKTYDVTVEVLSDDTPVPQPTAVPAASASPPTSVAADSSAASSAPRMPAAAGAVGSPMAGTVKSILVKQGDEVTAGKPLLILEAMKMENQITASSAGTVKIVNVREGASVQEGEVLLVIER